MSQQKRCVCLFTLPCSLVRWLILVSVSGTSLPGHEGNPRICPHTKSPVWNSTGLLCHPSSSEAFKHQHDLSVSELRHTDYTVPKLLLYSKQEFYMYKCYLPAFKFSCICSFSVTVTLHVDTG